MGCGQDETPRAAVARKAANDLARRNIWRLMGNDFGNG
jgi:hypothetical protein